MKSATHTRHDESTGLSGYGFLILFISSAAFASVFMFGDEWNDLLYRLQTVSGR